MSFLVHGRRTLSVEPTMAVEGGEEGRTLEPISKAPPTASLFQCYHWKQLKSIRIFTILRYYSLLFCNKKPQKSKGRLGSIVFIILKGLYLLCCIFSFASLR